MAVGQPLGQMIIELGLDSSTFASGMKGVKQQITTATGEMKAHLSVIGNSGSAVDILKAKQSGLTTVIDAQNKKVQLAKEKYEACRAEVEGNAGATQAQRDALVRAQNEYVRAIGELGSYENQLREVNIKLTAMESGVYKVGDELTVLGQRLTSAGDQMINIGKTLTTAITVPLLAVGTAAVKVTADFESSMSQIQATLGITSDAMSDLNGQSVNTMDALRDLAKEMGSNTKFTASQSADAINNLAMAGYRTQEIYDTLPQVLALASAGNLDLDYACRLAANGLNTMGLETKDLQELTDKMAVTASSAYGSVANFGEGILAVGNQADLCNVNLTDTYTALGILGDNGYSAAAGGTMLRNVLKNLYTPTDVAKKALKELGVESADSSGNLRNVQDVLQDLGGALDGLTADERVNVMNTIFDTRTIAGANALVKESGDRWNELSDAIDNSSGAAQQMADTQMDNLNGQLTILKSGVEGIGISFGEIMLPAIKKVVSGVQGLVDWLNNLNDQQKQTIVKVASVVAVIGPAVLIVGKLTKGIGKLITNIGDGMKAFALWAAKITHTTTAQTTQTTATAASTIATGANTAANATNTSGLMARTARVLLDSAASKASAVVEGARNLVIAAGNGTLALQAKALNASIAAKIKDKAASIASAAAEKAGALITGVSTTQISLSTIATAAKTVAMGACTVAAGFLKAALAALAGPIGIAVIAVAGLVAGVIAAVSWFTRETEASKKLKAEIEELTEENDTLIDSLDGTETAHQDNVASIKAGTAASKDLADKVKQLYAVENKTAAQKKELTRYIDKLNESNEGLNLSYDESADALNMTTDAVYGYIDAAELQLEAEEALNRMIEISKEQTEVKEQLVEVQNKITEATENTELKERERTKIVTALQEEEARLQEQHDSLQTSYVTLAAVVEEAAAAEAAAVTESTQTILEAYGTLAAAYQDLGAKQQEAVDGILAAYEKMTEGLTNLSKELVLDTETTWAEIQKNQEKAIQYTEEFSSLYAQCIEAGISESYLNAIGVTGPESLPLLREMMAMGTDEIKASESLWQESYGVVSDTLVDTLKVDGEVAAAIKEYVLGESGIYGTLKASVEAADLNALGKSLTEGLSNGILESTDHVVTATTDMSEAVVDTAKGVLDINSPSKVFEEIGKYTMEGLALGITNNANLLSAALEQVIPAAMSAVEKSITTALDGIEKSFSTGFGNVAKEVNSAMSNTSKSIAGGLSSIKATVSSEINAVSAAVRNGLTTIKSVFSSDINAILTVTRSGFGSIRCIISSEMSSAVSSARNAASSIVSALNIHAAMRANGVYAMSGFRSGLIDGAASVYAKAREIANNVAATIRNALRISSPSRVFMEIGKYTMEGFGLGMENMQPYLGEIAGDTVDMLTGSFDNVSMPALTSDMGALQSLSKMAADSGSSAYETEDQSLLCALMETAVELLQKLNQRGTEPNISIHFNPVLSGTQDMTAMFAKADKWLADKGVATEFGRRGRT